VIVARSWSTSWSDWSVVWRPAENVLGLGFQPF